MVRLVMRVCLTEGYTIRWRRGNAVAYVSADRQAGDGGAILGAIGTIPRLDDWLDGCRRGQGGCR